MCSFAERRKIPASCDPNSFTCSLWALKMKPTEQPVTYTHTNHLPLHKVIFVNMRKCHVVPQLLAPPSPGRFGCHRPKRRSLPRGGISHPPAESLSYPDSASTSQCGLISHLSLMQQIPMACVRQITISCC